MQTKSIGLIFGNPRRTAFCLVALALTSIAFQAFFDWHRHFLASQFVFASFSLPPPRPVLTLVQPLQLPLSRVPAKGGAQGFHVLVPGPAYLDWPLGAMLRVLFSPILNRTPRRPKSRSASNCGSTSLSRRAPFWHPRARFLAGQRR